MKSRFLACCWGLVIVAMCAWLVWRFAGESPVNTDLMELLPETERDLISAEAAQRFRQGFERRVVFLVSADDAGRARQAADYLFHQLDRANVFADLRLRYDPAALEQAGALYFPYRFQLLTERIRRQLQEADWQAFEQDLLAQYLSPASVLNSRLVAADPLMLLSRFLGERASQNGRFTIEDGYLSGTIDGQTMILLDARLAASPFLFAVQKEFGPLVHDLRQQIPQQFAGARLMVAGVVLHAIAGTERAQTEISTIGIGSMLSIAILLLIVFRSVRPLLLTSATILVGCIAGFAACLVVYGQINLLTLVFGASLVGTSVDYAMHYFSEGFRLGRHWKPRAALDHILPGISLGLITTIFGFAGLLLAPFPALNQIAVFSIAGLSFAYVSVVICLPLATQSRFCHDRPSRLLSVLTSYSRIWLQPWNWRRTAAFALSGMVLIVGFTRLQTQDDIRLLQSLDPAVSDEGRRVREALGKMPASQILLVEGLSIDDLLVKEEALTDQLRRLQRSGELGGYRAISDMVPSPARQTENRETLAQLIAGSDAPLLRIADIIGWEDGLVRDYRTEFERTQGQPPLRLGEWIESPASVPYADLWLGRTERGFASAVSLEGVRAVAPLASIANELEGVSLIDQVGALSSIFGEQRRSTVKLTLIAYLAVTVLLQMRYGLRGGLAVMLPPTFAAIASLGLLGLAGHPISLFNIMAMLLVLGIGVDYALFFRETGTSSETTMLAITLSAVTSILAFGLLAFSSTAALQAFGLTIMIGISIAFLLAPLAGLGIEKRHS